MSAHVFFCSKPPVAYHLTQDKIKAFTITAQLCRIFTQQPAPHISSSVSCFFPFCPHDHASDVPGFSFLKAFALAVLLLLHAPAQSSFLSLPQCHLLMRSSVYLYKMSSFTALPVPFLLYLFLLFILYII